MTFVAESLIASSNGKCPDCGTLVVTEFPLPEFVSVDAMTSARNTTEKLAVLIVNLPLSVRCRNKMQKLGAETLGEFLQFPAATVLDHFGGDQTSIEQILEMLEQHDILWRLPCSFDSHQSLPNSTDIQKLGEHNSGEQ